MKTRIASLLILIATFFSLSAAAHQKEDSRRKEWEKEMAKVRLDFIAGQLDLSADQKQKFVEIYNSMQAELDKLREDTKSLRMSIEDKNATDLEYEKAAEALFEFKQKEGTIELKYFDQFKNVLTPKQLFQLKTAEMKWMKELMKHRKKK